jgi:hypothetical protein
MLKGRVAHELLATILENRVQPDGVAGSTIAVMSHLNYVVDPNKKRHDVYVAKPAKGVG